MTMLRNTTLSLLVCSFSLCAVTQTARAAGPGPAIGEPASFMLDKPLPEVLTATRLRQPKTKVPASVTIIPGDLIHQLGITSIWDVFHLVPGMTVAFVASNKPAVSYHGTVAGAQRRLQVMIDGRSSYNIDLADVNWHTLPVALENIERIEITRGPDAAAYGVNSFLAIINIITKSAQDTQGAYVRVTDGSKDFKRYFGRVSDHVGNYDYRLSYLKKESDGFDYRYAKNDDNYIGPRFPFNDGYGVGTVNYASTYQPDSNHALTFNAGATHYREDEDGDMQYGPEYGMQNQPNAFGEDYYGQVKWTQDLSDRHFYHVQVYYQTQHRDQNWNSCLNLKDIGATPTDYLICADANQNSDESRVDYELQDTYVFSDNLRMVTGANYREDRFDSETYFGGSGSNYQGHVLANVEYSPLDWLTANVGGMWEHTAEAGSFFSPRYALNFPFADNQALRLIYSKAYRTPDAFEQSANWSYTVRNITPALPNGDTQAVLLPFQAPGGLHAEQIISREISYYGQFRLDQGVLSSEIKFYHDTLSDLIAGRMGVDNWDIENDVILKQQGFEVEAALEYPSNYYRLTYAYIDQDGTYTGDQVDPQTNPRAAHRYVEFESRLTAQHSGSAVWIHHFPYDITSSLAYYFADRLNFWPYQRLDTRLAKTLYLPRMSFEAAFLLKHYVDGDPIAYGSNNYSGQNQFFVEASARF